MAPAVVKSKGVVKQKVVQLADANVRLPHMSFESPSQKTTTTTTMTTTTTTMIVSTSRRTTKQ